MKKLFVGTSGWAYSHWKSVFYPEKLKPKDRLKYFSQRFKTTEVNYSFYRLPKPAVYKNWYFQTPKDFLFAVKASRFITHVKRLKEAEQPWKAFITNSLNLKEKLGPVLLQMPPEFKCNAENLSRMEKFLVFAGRIKKPNGGKRNAETRAKGLRLAVEVRNSSFENSDFFNLLERRNTALVISNSPAWKEIEKPGLADFVYVRMHGSKVLFSSNYTKRELERLAQKIKKWLRNKDVFVYFNNDACGYAVKNAETLIGLLAGKFP